MIKTIKKYLNRIYIFEDPTLDHEEYTYLHRSSKFIEKMHWLRDIYLTSFIFLGGLVVGLAFSEMALGTLLSFGIISLSLSGALFWIFDGIYDRAWENGENMPLEAKIDKKRAHIQKLGYTSIEAFDEYVLKEDFPKLKNINAEV